MANMQDGAAEGIQKQPEVVEVKGNVGHGRLQWTNVMSGFVLRHFCDLVAEGVKTDKGFKEVHLNQVANSLKEFTGQDVTGTQVYNHLRKWRARWVKICRLKDLNGTGWDKDNFMITMEPDHYNGHVKDAEFLNLPLLNYNRCKSFLDLVLLQGRFAMGSNEPLGEQPAATQDPINLDAEAPEGINATDKASMNAEKDKPKPSSTAGKRKRTCQDE